MALNFSVLGAKHPRFDGMAYWPLSIFTNSVVEIYEPSSTYADWDPGTGIVESERKALYKGYAAVTPNMDWRARDRRSAYDDTATHAYRVQLWHIDKNMLVPQEQWGDRDLRFEPEYGQIVKVLEHNSDPKRVGMQFVVRNATSDSDWWQPTLLCDTDVGDLHGRTH